MTQFRSSIIRYLLMALAVGWMGLASRMLLAQEILASPIPAPATSVPLAQRRLSVMVIGSGKAVAEAEVLFSAKSMADKKLFTDDKGLVSWVPPPVRRLKVRVIAAGWMTHQNEIDLPDGPLQQHVVQLSPMPPAGPVQK